MKNTFGVTPKISLTKDSVLAPSDIDSILKEQKGEKLEERVEKLNAAISTVPHLKLNERVLPTIKFNNKKLENLIDTRTDLNINMENKAGSLGKVTTIIAKNNGNITNIRFNNRKKDFYETVIDIEVRDKNHLSNIIAALRLLNEVSSCERIKG